MRFLVWPKTLALASILLGCTAGSQNKDTSSAREVGPDSGLTEETDPELGFNTYQAKCAVCHGVEGKGGAGPNLTDGRLARLNNVDVENIVRDGTDDMPSFGSRLSEDEIVAVAEHVLTTFGSS